MKDNDYTFKELKTISRFLGYKPPDDISQATLLNHLQQFKDIFIKDKLDEKLKSTINTFFYTTITDKFYFPPSANSPSTIEYEFEPVTAYLPMLKKFNSSCSYRQKIGGLPYIIKGDKLPKYKNQDLVFLCQFHGFYEKKLIQIWINPDYQNLDDPDKIVIIKKYSYHDIGEATPEDDKIVRRMLNEQDILLEEHQDIVGYALLNIFNAMVKLGVYKKTLFKKEDYTLDKEYRIVRWLKVSEYVDYHQDKIFDCFKISGYPYSNQDLSENYYENNFIYNNILIHQWGDDGVIHIDGQGNMNGDMA